MPFGEEVEAGLAPPVGGGGQAPASGATAEAEVRGRRRPRPVLDGAVALVVVRGGAPRGDGGAGERDAAEAEAPAVGGEDEALSEVEGAVGEAGRSSVGGGGLEDGDARDGGRGDGTGGEARLTRGQDPQPAGVAPDLGQERGAGVRVDLDGAVVGCAGDDRVEDGGEDVDGLPGRSLAQLRDGLGEALDGDGLGLPGAIEGSGARRTRTPSPEFSMRAWTTRTSRPVVRVWKRFSTRTEPAVPAASEASAPSRSGVAMTGATAFAQALVPALGAELADTMPSQTKLPSCTASPKSPP